jgi:hypothetical protein
MKGLFLKKLFWAMDSGLAAFSLRSVSALARSMLAMVYGELCREVGDCMRGKPSHLEIPVFVVLLLTIICLL